MQNRPVICFNALFGPGELTSPYLWKEYIGAKPLKNAMHITHHGRSEAVTRVLTDFGSEESFGRAVKRCTAHYKYPLHPTTGARVANQIDKEALERQFRGFSVFSTRPISPSICMRPPKLWESGNKTEQSG